VVWMDSKPVWLLSTTTNPIDPDSVAPRWVRWERVDFPTSPILLEYQAYMRGVDIVDQCRGYYNIALESHKWWHRCFTLMIDSSLHNGYVLYVEDANQVGLATYSRQLWYYILAKAMVAPFTHVNVPRGPYRNLSRRGFHHSEQHDGVRRCCVICGTRTQQFCGGCRGRFMCTDPYYVRVHTQPQYAAWALAR
jgi:hypothetical protein